MDLIVDDACHSCVCAALGALIVWRPPIEALLYFAVIVLLGNMVRREAESLI